LKLKADKRFIEVDDKAILSTKEKLQALVKAKASKKTIAKVAVILAAEEGKKADATKDMVSELELIKTEKAEVDKLWNEIKSMKGHGKHHKYMMRDGNKKALWKKLMALKKEIAMKDKKLIMDKKMEYLDEKEIGVLKAKVEALVKAHADNKTIAEVV